MEFSLKLIFCSFLKEAFLKGFDESERNTMLQLCSRTVIEAYPKAAVGESCHVLSSCHSACPWPTGRTRWR